MSAINNFNIIGFVKEQKPFETPSGVKKASLVLECNRETSKGTITYPLEVQVLGEMVDKNYVGCDIAVSGFVSGYLSKAGYINIVLNVSALQILSNLEQCKKTSSMVMQTKHSNEGTHITEPDRPTQNASYIDPDNLPF